MRNKSLLLAMASVIGLSACQKEQSETETAATQEPAAVSEQATKMTTMTREQVEALSETDRQAYALGEYMGGSAYQFKDMGIELNVDVLKQGFAAALNGEALYTPQEAGVFLQALQQAAQAKQQELAGAEADKNAAEGAEYLAEAAKKEGAMTTESGIVYEVITAAEGEKPTADSTVTVHYSGTLIDGTKFDSSYDRGQPSSFPLNGVIKGWTEGLQLMSVGSKYRFHIPGNLAYGKQGRPSIPPNATLVFDVELISINTTNK